MLFSKVPAGWSQITQTELLLSPVYTSNLPHFKPHPVYRTVHSFIHYKERPEKFVTRWWLIVTVSKACCVLKMVAVKKHKDVNRFFPQMCLFCDHLSDANADY